MNNLLLQLCMIVLILCAGVWVADAQDAALVAQTVTGDSRTVEAVSFELAELDFAQDRRLWFDAFGVTSLAAMDFADAGAGLSVDVTPRQDWCAGGGYYQGWLLYAGRHVTW
jgi:hypothetical protein